MASRRLSAEDWIKAGFRALKTGGVPALRVESIARDLSVSKGSFYHHFKDLRDLQSRMIAHWRDRATDDIIDFVDATGGTPFDRLTVLIEAATASTDAPYGGPGTEASIRAWSYHDAMVAKAQTSVDATRLSYLATLMREAGHEKAAALEWARLFLSAYLGSAEAPKVERVQMLKTIVRLAEAT